MVAELPSRQRQNPQETHENDSSIKIGVYNETSPLKTVAMWGSPGPEAVLAQLLPPDINLFFSSFNVVSARAEYQKMLDHISKHGVNVVLVQDLLLSNVDTSKLPDREMIPRSTQELIDAIQTRGLELQRRYNVGNINTLDLVPALVEEDIARLGEEQAVLLNWMLCLRHLHPSGDIFYGRDQSNVLGNMLLWSNMRWPIRKPEVGLYKTALERLIGPDKCCRVRGKDAYLEGGDGIMVDGDVFLGVGGRTTYPAAFDVYNSLRPYLGATGKQMYLIADSEAERRAHTQKAPGEEMGAMHLDTYWMPFGKRERKNVLCCMDDVSKRTVHRITDDNGHMQLTSLGSFDRFLDTNGFSVHDIPKDEQGRYATNFLNLTSEAAIVPFSDNTVAISHLNNEGVDTLPVEVKELGGGYGAVHCMTAALERKD